MRPLLYAVAVVVTSGAYAQTSDNPTLIIRNNRFEPSEIVIPPDTKVKLTVRNEDSTPEEFESHDLKREKVIAPGKQVDLNIGPLKPGRYEFVGEFHPKTARGFIVVK